MKKLAKFLDRSLLTVLFLLGVVVSNGQSVTLLPNQGPLTPGQIVLVPITMTATFSSAEFYINYDRDVLTPASPFTTALDSRFNLGIINANWNPAINPSAIAFVPLENPDFLNITMDGEPIVTLRFIFNGGSSTLHLRKSPDANPLSKLFDEFGTPITGVTYTDATMNGPLTTVYSAAAGGSWASASTWKLDLAGTLAGFVPTGNVNAVITSNTVTVGATARAKDLSINPGGKLTVNSTFGLTTTGNFTILSSASGTGSFLNNGTLTVAGTISAQRWLTASWDGGFPTATTIWHYVSPPVSGATINTFLGSLLNSWNEPLNKWDPLTIPVTTPLVPAFGYGVAKHTPDGIVTFSGGTLNNAASYSPSVSLTGTYGPGTGWNLIGNPYPCAIDWDLLTKTNILGSVYTWNATTHNYASYASGIGTLTDGILPSEQAFFVQALTTGAAITIPSSSRLHSATGLYKNTAEDLITMNVKGSGVGEDIAIIHFRPEATTEFDNDFDAFKLFGMEDAPQLYSMTTTDNLSINTLPDVSSHPVIAMGLSVGFNDTYTFTASDLESFPAGTEIVLEDLKTNYSQNIASNPVYSFTAAPGDPIHRFNVHFSPVGMSDNKHSGLKIYSVEKTVYVNVTSEMKGNIIVYNLLGSEITRKPVQSNTLNKINLDVPTGFYLIKVEGDNSSSAEKVFIR
jgi:hypothetical protein